MTAGSAGEVAGLHVASAGRGPRPLLLVHGFGAHGHSWRHWVPRLAPHHPVHVVDLLGAGRSGAPAEADYAPEAQAARVAEVVRALPGPPPVLVGHSLGAGICVLAWLELAERTPDRLPPALVLVSGAVLPQALPPFLSLARIPILGEALFLRPPPRPVLRAGIRAIVGRGAPVDRAMVEGYRAPFADPARRRALRRGARALDLDRARALAEALPRVRVPVLLLWGEADRIVSPAQGRALASKFPSATLRILPGVGHLPAEEAPEASAALVLEFLREVAPPDP